MSFKLNIQLSMIIDSNTHLTSIEEICNSLKEALGFSREHDSPGFDLNISFSSIDKTEITYIPV